MIVEQGLESYFLYASSIYVSRRPTEIQTVLGSCVAVCLYDTIQKVGGMNHYMLPVWKGEGLATAKYGNIAIDKLMEKMESLGSSRRNLVAKIFGGAEQLAGNSFFGIGKRNILLAEEHLSDLKIPILSSSVGGQTGRKIVFNSSTGLVYMKFVSQT